MDIQCPTCATPWGVHHLKGIEPTRWGISKEDQKRLRDGDGFSGADDPALKAAEAAGWRFASERLLSFTCCASCPPAGTHPDAQQGRAAPPFAHALVDLDMEALLTFLAGEMAGIIENAPVTALFALGRIFITPGALDALRDAGEQPTALLGRHARGDWSALGEEDAARNRKAVEQGQTVVSVFTLRTGKRVYVLTEWDRSATTILLPSEY